MPPQRPQNGPVSETAKRIPLAHIGCAVRAALAQKALDPDPDTAAIFYDLSFLENRLQELKDAFPDNTLHAVAVKANPLLKVLRLIENHGFAVESSSFGELHLAEKAGFPPDKIIFDSPVKTIPELEYALQKGIYINADSLEELARIAVLKEKYPDSGPVGLRLNPQVGMGNISMTSVAGPYSKFGVPLNDRRKDILQAFARYPWLKGVHIHIGSQGNPVELLLKGAEVLITFINVINAQSKSLGRRMQITTIDIGGGLPVAYRPGDSFPDLKSYARQLLPILQRLNDKNYRLITEFGRYLHANAGWTVTRIEYLKESDRATTLILHIGADLLLRRCYRPEDWHHEFSVLDSRGNLKPSSPTYPYILAGPLCFGGDILARDIHLPKVEPGDYIVVHDTGAYTLSMWSRYNSRPIPKVIGYRREPPFETSEQYEFTILKSRESLEDIAEFWE